MPDKVSILKESGESLTSTIVSVLSIPESDKKYMITTENTVDPHGLTVLHVSEVSDGTLQRIATDEEWSSIKTIMRAIISGNVGSFKYLPAIENINATGQYSRDISVSATAAKQMIDSYTNADKSLTDDSASEEEEPIQNIVQPPAAPEMEQAVSAAPIDPNAQVQQAAPVDPNAAVAPVAPIDPAMQVPGVEAPAVDPNVVQPIADPMNVVPGVETVPAVDLGSPTGTTVSPATITPENIAVPNGVVAPNIDLMPDNQPAMVAEPVSVETQPDMSVNTMPATPEMGNPLGVATPIMDSNPMEFNNDVQTIPGMEMNTEMPPEMVAEPVPSEDSLTQTASSVPAGQIVDPSVEGELNPNSPASFAPDASLDSVVVAAQEMFMEGVRNLVQTIQEKVYREMFNKENELKQREAMIEQKEKMFNDQMMMFMNNNFAAMQANMNQPVTQMQPAQGVVPPQPVAPMAQPVQQVQPLPQNPVMTPQAVPPVMPPFAPTVVEASNDTVN